MTLNINKIVKKSIPDHLKGFKMLAKISYSHRICAIIQCKSFLPKCSFMLLVSLPSYADFSGKYMYFIPLLGQTPFDLYASQFSKILLELDVSLNE